MAEDSKSEYPMTKTPMSCPHCGNKAPMFILCDCKLTEQVDFEVGDVPGDYEYEYYRWRVLLCPSCRDVCVLQDRQATWDEIPDVNGDWRPVTTTTFLYPMERRSFRHLPQTVAKSYGQAIKVLPVEPTMFAVAVGLTLEFLCEDRNAKGRNLAEKLGNLVQRNEIPKRLAEMAHGLRYFRNLGAHADIEISRRDAETLRELCETILEYVYEAPAMLQQVQDRINQLRSGSGG